VARVVTLLGGESTGKTSLAQALCERLNRLGVSTHLVPEYLRHWCETQGRAPHADEQAELASTQARLIDEAACRHDLRVVLADTTPLVIAAYSELYFKDTGLLSGARDWQQRVDLTLLMGLDLPWVPDGLFRDSEAIRDATDAVVRRELQRAGIPFQTIYGQGAARLDQALRVLGRTLGQDLGAPDADWPQGRRPWNCEKCSDPDCEHRLFTTLLARDTTGEPTP
jgi:HTH-type transcriptional regulator, transcriptional repressor of NAD biosynthesis genes